MHKGYTRCPGCGVMVNAPLCRTCERGPAPRETLLVQGLRHAMEALDLLQDAFGVRCRLAVSKGRRAYAFYKSTTIRIPDCVLIASDDRLDECICHEYAHLVALARTPQKTNWYVQGPTRRTASGRVVRDGHGDVFRVALEDVAAAWYGHPDRYPWHREYAKIAAWAKVRGYVAPAVAAEAVKPAVPFRMRFVGMKVVCEREQK